MGFYPPDSLIHEAQRRGLEVLPPDVDRSGVECSVVVSGSSIVDEKLPAVRIGLGYVQGVRGDEVAALVAARDEGGPFRSLEDLASRAGAGRAALDQLAWSGACDALAGGDRRAALWRLGIAAPARRPGRAEPAGTQLSLPLALPGAPRLERLGEWDEMVADYATTGLSARRHPLGLLREELRARGTASSADLQRLPHGSSVRIGGLVVARQRPGTANGMTFLLLEDEHGTVNLVVAPPVYERDRLAVRAEPLVVADGRLERHPAHGGGVNVVVRRLVALDAPAPAGGQVRELAGAGAAGAERPDTTVKDFSVLDEPAVAAGAGGGAGFRAVAPAVESFTQGRRR